MKKSLYFLLLTSILSCISPTEKPNSLIDKDDFINILTEIYLYKNLNPGMVSNHNPNLQEIYGHIFTKYNITGKQYQDNFNYYMIAEENSQEILEEVKANLKIKAKELHVGIKKEVEQPKDGNSLPKQ